MDKKSGFTLVELLAVIVILAIILVIAVPGISGVVKSATKGAFKSDAKMVLQAIDYKKLEDRDFNPLEVTKDNMDELLDLGNENYDQLNLSLADGNINILIVGKNKWAGFTAYGTIKNMNVVNTDDYDVIPPSITILGENPLNIGRGSTYVDQGATATDLKDGNVEISSIVIRNSSNEVVDEIDTSIFTTYTITYTAIDTNGNTASSIRRINVVDMIPPTITILGDTNVTIHKGDQYIDAGATATDDVDGDLTSSIITTGSVNPSIVGTYTINYTVSDNYGNIAIRVRTVNVVDISAPVISLLGEDTITIYLGEIYIDAGATALDDVDGDVTNGIVITGTVNPSVVGTYVITYTVTDSSNNEAIITRTVNVLTNVFIYSYVGDYQIFTAPRTGNYQIELWGAQGYSSLGGKGSYTKGIISLTTNTTMYVYVGQTGQSVSTRSLLSFNGGGGGSATCHNYYNNGTSNNWQGGGATDIRLTSGAWNSTEGLKSRIMIAAGGGGIGWGSVNGGNGGGLEGYDGGYLERATAYGLKATQTLGGSRDGVFGIGGTSADDSAGCNCSEGAGGGGGYYGGGGSREVGYYYGGSGAGGSSFISGHTGCNAINTLGEHTGTPNHYSDKIFSSTVMIDGAGYGWTNVKGALQQMPKPSGGYFTAGEGNTGNGFARITYLP